MRQPTTDAAAIAAEIARIQPLPRDRLRRMWRAVFGRTPPASLSTSLLGRTIAWHIQERAFGGLDRDSLRFLSASERIAIRQINKVTGNRLRQQFVDEETCRPQELGLGGPTLRTPRRRSRTRGRAIAHGIQPGPKADATRLSTGSVLRPRNELNPVPA